MTAPVIVLGMHHSGSTFVAKQLEKAGVRMCFRQHHDNHCECADIFALNHLEVDDYGPRPAKPYKARQMFVNALVEYRRERQAQSGNSPWGFKDPQCALLCESYFRAFQGAKFILCTRDSHRVASTRMQRGHSYDIMRSVREHAWILAECVRLADQYKVNFMFYECDGNPYVQEDVLRRFTGIQGLTLFQDWELVGLDYTKAPKPLIYKEPGRWKRWLREKLEEAGK